MSVKDLAAFMGVSKQRAHQNKSKIQYRRIEKLLFSHRDAISEGLSIGANTEAAPVLSEGESKNFIGSNLG